MKRAIFYLVSDVMLLGLALILSLGVIALLPGTGGVVEAQSPPTNITCNTTGWWWTGNTTTYNATSTPIQAAIDNSSDGGTINVAAGTYTITSTINVNKEVTITGDTGSPSSVLVTYAAPSQTLDCFDMQANNVTVQGISAVNGRYGFNFATSDPTGCTISHCVIDHCYEGAINIDGGSGHTISNNTITNCLTSGTKSGVIYIYGCPDTTIDGNTLTGNGLTGAHATMGIYVKFTYPSSSSERVEVINNNISGMLGINADIQVYDAPYTYIYNNTISNSEDKGIAIFGIQGNPAYTSTDNRVEVIGNTISSTYYPGLQACNAPYAYFYNNALTKCNYYGGDGTGDFDYASIHIDVGSANCLIDSNTVSDGINGIQLWSDSCTVTNNTIYDMGLTYADTKTTGDGTYYNSAILYGDMYDVNMPASATISNNNIYDNYWGLFVIAYTGTVTAENNWWGDASGPGGVGPGTGDAVSDSVDYCPWLLYPYPQPLTEVWVDNDWAERNCGDEVESSKYFGINAFDKIQDGIDAVAGSTVHVANGTYNATSSPFVRITTDNLTLIGESRDGVILDGTGTSTIDWAKGIHVTANNVTIKNLTVQNFGTDPAKCGYGVLFRDYAHDTEGEGFVYYTGCTVDNVKSQNNCYPMYAFCNQHLIVQNCLIQNNLSDGMFIAKGSSYATITGNTVLNSGDHGIWVGGSSWCGPSCPNATIINNIVNGAREGGISFVASDTATISGNTITNVAGETSPDGYSAGALSLIGDCSNVTATSNVIYNNSGTWGGHNGTGNGVGIKYGTPSNINLHDNNIYGNTGYGCQNYAGVTINATNNWWGDPAGPSGEGYGTGDAVSTYVDYDPWLDATYPGGGSTTFTGKARDYVADDTLDAIASASTSVDVTGTANVTAARYDHNPGTGFSGDMGKYIDVHISNSTATQLVIKLHYTDDEVAGKNEASLRMRWWNGTASAWEACSDSGVDTAANYIWARITNITTPSLTQLGGTPFGGGAPTAEAGPNRSISTGGSVAIGGNPTGSGGTGNLTYSWSPAVGLNSATVANPVASPPSTTTYTVVVTDVNGCSASDSMTVTVTAPPGGGGDESHGGIDICSFRVDMMGKITTVNITCGTYSMVVGSYLISDSSGVNFLELDSGIRVSCNRSGCPLCGRAPNVVIMSPSLNPPPAPENMEIIGQVYNFTGYFTSYYNYSSMCCNSVIFGDPIGVVLGYNPDDLPQATSGLAIAYYDYGQNSWINLPPNVGRVAEIGEATALVNHFSTMAVLADLSPSPATFATSELSIVPGQAKPGGIITITAYVTNDGGQGGSTVVELMVNGEVLDSQEVTLSAGQSQQVSFTFSGTDGGQYDVEIAGLSGEFTILPGGGFNWLWIVIGIVVAGGLVAWAIITGRKKSAM